MTPEIAELAGRLSEPASKFLASVGIACWWRTEEGERVPQSLLTKGLVERQKIGGIDFAQYRLTPLGLQVRNHLLEHPHG
jgi:hypothetical protein